MNGVGVGLRPNHYATFLRGEAGVARWVEVNAEKYLRGTDDTDAHHQVLRLVRERMPVVLHGTSMSLGSATVDNTEYLTRLRDLCDVIEPTLVSDHLCWSGVDGVKLFDLLPLPFTEDVVELLAERILAAQDVLRRRILVENLSSYVQFAESEMPEWEFISEVLRRADCDLLLDINNVYVTCSNHGWDSREFLRGIPHDRVRQIHLAGHLDTGHVKIDSHGEYTVEPVWELFRWYVATYGPVAAMIEWDKNIPAWPDLERELRKVEAILAQESRCA
jgi:uncharacterized protein (UPF0276 family)